MPAPAAAAKEEGLSVIALVSGGKDSFFSILHCLANGHRVVALANLHPPQPSPRALGTGVAGTSCSSSAQALDPVDEVTGVTVVLPGENVSRAQGHGHGHDQGEGQSQPGLVVGEGREEALRDSPAGTILHDEGEQGQAEEEDLNSFMYQTVGHQVIPLYAEATGLPLYRKAIVGDAGKHGKDYSHHSPSEGPSDETESMIPLLRAIKAAHPEANAICAGAILSTYQRTRVESVATRLGLVPLAYLWKFPTLPVPMSSSGGAESDAQLLDDMAAVGLEARIIKVASGGLDDSFLWTNVANAAGKDRIARSMRRYGTAEKGAVIGEGGEFETLVLDGPSELFKKRIVIDEQDRKVVYEGGGTAWLSFRTGGAHLVDKARKGDRDHDISVNHVRIPDLLDDRFVSVIGTLSEENLDEALTKDWQKSGDAKEHLLQENLPHLGSLQKSPFQQWSFANANGAAASITEETSSLIAQIRQRLDQHNLAPTAIINSTIVLRRMADFPTINGIYGSLFDAPNPPSRVTISCGDSLLPLEANISISLSVHTALQPGQRQGLHVQSRSYWAPANIGPYSQAISFPLGSLGSSRREQSSSSGNGPRLVSIAGQIPLVPATMDLPPASTDELGYQLVLSLQHLWRIGLDVDVRWWTSGVVYFPRQEQKEGIEQASSSMRLRAQLAGKTWEAAHMWSGTKRNKESNDNDLDQESDDDEEDDTGPDLWDRRFNTQYMSFAAAGDGEKAKGQKLPDWAVLDEDESKILALQNGSSKKARRAVMVPPLFAAEVEELPRGAGAEWHAHLGVAGGDEDTVVVLKGERRGKFAVYQTIVRSDAMGTGMNMVQTIVAEDLSSHQALSLEARTDASLSISSAKFSFEEQDGLAREAVARLGNVGKDEPLPVIVVRYLDVGVYQDAQQDAGSTIPIVPCRSLWNGTVIGERLASVTVYQSVFGK
ncbi:hypothetical protein V8F20_012587 [Naviculisporaceae sp. PSN 640]